MATKKHLIDSDKGSANGVASLDAGSKVPLAQLDTGADGLAVKIGGKLQKSEIPSGTASGDVVVVQATGHIDPLLLPGSLDDIEFFTGIANIPTSGSSETMYIDRATGKEYLWDGSAMVEKTVPASSNPTTNIVMPNSTTGLVLVSPNGTSFVVLVDDDGALTTTTPVV